VRVALLLVVLTGCRQLLGFEEPSIASMDGPAPDVATDSAMDSAVDAPADAPPTMFDLSTCPAAYTVAAGTSRYRVVAGNAPSWTAAANDCASDLSGATHLIVVDDLAEYSMALTMLLDNAPKWIGLSDRKTNGVFLAVTDQAPAFPPASGPPWAQGQPTSGCVEITALGQLIADACGKNFGYICECDGVPNNPANY